MSSESGGGGVLRGVGAALLGNAAGGAGDGGVLERERQPSGWPGFINGTDKLNGVDPPSRGGLFDSQQLIGELSLADAQSTRVPSSSVAGLAATQTEFLKASAVLDSPSEHFSKLKRPATPILAYVDRASFPGYIDADSYGDQSLHVARELQHQHHALRSLPELGESASAVAATGGLPRSLVLPAAPATTIATEDLNPYSTKEALPGSGIGFSEDADARWEKELLEWKRYYGCPDVDASVAQSTATETPAGAGLVGATEPPKLHRPPGSGTSSSAAPPAVARSLDGDASGRACGSLPTQSRVPDVASGDDPGQLGWLTREPWPTVSAMELDTTLTQPIGASGASVGNESGRAPPPFPLSQGGVAGSRPTADHVQDLQASGSGAAPTMSAPPPFPLGGKNDPASASPASPRGGGGPGNIAGSDARRLGTSGTTKVLEDALQAPPTAIATQAALRPDDSPTKGRKYVYTQQDLDVATRSAASRLMADGSYNTEYSEAGIQVRDFFVDLRKQRAKDKGRQATGPIWIHLGSQAKNLASSFALNELIEALKLFCSVRYEDYELYMRLLGEVPHYVKLANADQLCELIRILARRRLRERNYVDMVAAHFLKKIRVTDDSLPARLLIKCANAFASLECRSQPKFVEHFLRHMEHRIEELDGELCCLVSPCFVAHYMSDSLRRAFLKRCAETQAGFHGDLDLLRNLAMIEIVIRKEHHSFAASLPTYVTRFLEKVRQHAQFDGWGAVTLPPAVAPDGPKGNHKAEMSLSLQRKASTATGGARGDVFSSDMHRDVSACLTHLGIEHENGVLCGPFLLDIVALDMVNPSKRITYEVNSPHHYYEGTETLIAEKRLRHRMLGRLGQKLHHVHAHDWRALSSAQKMTFILKLQQAQQDENTLDAKQQAAANTMRAPLHPVPILPYAAAKKPEPFMLKSVPKLQAPPIRVPTPPSLKTRRAPLSAR